MDGNSTSSTPFALSQNGTGYNPRAGFSLPNSTNTNVVNPNSPILSQLNPNQAQQPAAQETTKQDNGNWFTRLLPTIGSIALPTLGALLAPETGGASLLASIALAGAGGAGGKVAQNAVEGKDLGNNVLESGAEGAGGQLLGAGIGKALSGAGKLVGNVATGGIERAAADEAAQAAAKTAQQTRDTWMGVPTGMRKNLDLAGKQELAQRLGIDINDPQQWVNSSSSASDILNNVINESLSKAGKLDTADFKDLLKSALQKYQGTLGSLDPVAIRKGLIGMPNNEAAKLYNQLKNLASGFNEDGVGYLSGDPIAMRNFISKVGEIGADAKPTISATTGAIDSVQKDKYNAVQDLYSALKDKLYSNGNTTSTIKSLTGNILPEDVGGNVSLANHVNDIITNAQTPQDILDGLKTFTDMNKLGTSGLNAAKDVASAQTVREARQELPGAGLNSYQVISNGLSDAGKGGIISHALNLGKNVIGSVGAGGKVSQNAVKLTNLLERIAPIAGTTTGQVIANSPNYVPEGSGQGTNIGLNMEPPTSGNPVQDILNSNSPNAIPEQMLLTLMQHGGGYNVPSQIAAIAPSAEKSLATLSQASNAQAQLGNLVRMYNEAGGAQGPIGGILARLGGFITGSPAGQYPQQAQQLVDQINQLTGSHIQAPSLTMNREAAQGVLDQLARALTSYGANGGYSAL